MDQTVTDPQPPVPETLERLAAVVGARHAIADAADMAPYLTEWRDKYFGKAAMVLRPGSAEKWPAF